MLRRLSQIESAKVLADSGTDQSDIKFRDPLTAIWVRMSATNGGTSNKAATMFDCLSKIELIDGGKTLISLTGKEAFALYSYMLGFMPYALVDEVAGDEQTAVFPLMFGRWIGDPSFALNPLKFTNPQVRYQWNLAAVRAVGATGFVSGTGRLDLLAEVLEGAPTPVGLLTAKEHYAFTVAASGVTYVDLPTDNPIKALMLRGWLAANYASACFSNVKINIDAGKFVPYDGSLLKLLEYYTSRHAPFVYKHNWWCVDGDTLYTLLKQDEVVAGGPCGGGDTTFQYANVGNGEGAVDLLTGGSTESGLHQIQSVVTGWMPYGCTYIPLGEPTDPEDWLPAPAFGSIRLELTNNQNTAAASVVVQQAEAYT